jgi:hypothetical protein
VYGKAAAPHRQASDGALQFFDQLRAIGQPGQRVMMGEKPDAPVSVLHLCFPIPGNCGNGEGET